MSALNNWTRKRLSFQIHYIILYDKMNFVHLDHTSESYIRILRQQCSALYEIPLSTINLNYSLNPLRMVLSLMSFLMYLWDFPQFFDPNRPSIKSTQIVAKTFLFQNLTIPFSSMYLSYLHLSSYLSTSDMYENTIDPPPTCGITLVQNPSKSFM